MADLVPGHAPRVLGTASLLLLALAVLLLLGGFAHPTAPTVALAPDPVALPSSADSVTSHSSPVSSAHELAAPVVPRLRGGTTYQVTFSLLPSASAGLLWLNSSLLPPGGMTITSDETIALAPGAYDYQENVSNANLWTPGLITGGPTKDVDFSGGQLIILATGGFVNATFDPVDYLVTIETAPQGVCTGVNVSIQGTEYAPGTVAHLQQGQYTITTGSGNCTGYKFTNFTVSGHVIITGTLLTVDANGVVTANFVPIWYTLQGQVMVYGNRTALAGADVHVIDYGTGNQVNATVSGNGGTWGGQGISEIAGTYLVWASGTGYVGLNETVVVTDFDVSGIIIWVNSTTPAPPSASLATYLSTWPGVLVPITLGLVIFASLLYYVIERTKKRRARAGPPRPYGPPPGAVRPGAPPGPPPRQLPPGRPPGGPYPPPQSYPPRAGPPSGPGGY